MKTPNSRQPPLNFMKYRTWYYLLSAVVILPGLILLFFGGFKPAIDFTGGSLLEIQLPPAFPLTDTQLAAYLPSTVTLAAVVHTQENTLVLRTSPLNKNQADLFRYHLATASAELVNATTTAQLAPMTEIRFETIGPTLGQELLQKTVVALLLAGSAILAYIAYRFKNLKYGVSAILAMFHDSFVVISLFALWGYFYGVEVDTLFVTALLTILSFSVHDTIVVYDRIRESAKRFPSVPYVHLVNLALTETIGRSINNSLTIIFMLLSLLLFGGVTIRWFVMALLIGTISGTYSSPFIAAPLLIEWDRLAAKLAHFKKRRR
ncbi:protein-export membrane protein SecF [Microgenomates group bacterium RBG_16_45_19]|nr:MAG: protein-export membrane protein SecF [Microgenomates group bacterium RBG_16_45_19]